MCCGSGGGGGDDNCGGCPKSGYRLGIENWLEVMVGGRRGWNYQVKWQPRKGKGEKKMFK